MNIQLKLLSIKKINHDISSFKFSKPKEFKFIPGHSAMINIEKQGFENSRIPLTFTSLNSDVEIEFLIKNYPGKLTSEFHKLNQGDIVRISSIFGSIRYQKPGIFIAHGIAIAPVLSILRQLKLENPEEAKENFLFFSNRTKEDIIFESELKSILGKNCIISLTKEISNDYENGRITEEMIKKYISDTNREFYILGSEQFLIDMKNIVKNISMKK